MLLQIRITIFLRILNIFCDTRQTKKDKTYWANCSFRGKVTNVNDMYIRRKCIETSEILLRGLNRGAERPGPETFK